jgi:2-methylcitrate dehydratase PrpD
MVGLLQTSGCTYAPKFRRPACIQLSGRVNASADAPATHRICGLARAAARPPGAEAYVRRTILPEFPMRTTRQLAEFVSATAYADIDKAVVERTKDLALRGLSSAALGAQMQVSRLMVDYVREQGAPPEAAVIGHGFKTSAQWAAVLNCTASHCTELEDVAWPDATYTCFLIPTVFALGEKLRASGRDVLEAIVIGYEIASRPGVILADAGGVARGWLTGALLGTAGVAAAAAKMMRLTPEQTHHALAVAASFGAGLNRQTGSGAHVIEPGFAGRNGIMAAELAARGLTGNPTIFEGRAGFWDAIAGQPEIEFPLGRGADFRVMAVGMKKYPCCYLTQRIIDGVLELRARHGLSAEDIEQVEIGVNAIFPQILKYPEPGNAEEARFSLPHIIASAISGESMSVDTFTEAKVKDPALAAQRAKVKMTVHPEWGQAQLGEKNTLAITTRDGRVLEKVCVTAKGDPEYPLTREEVLASFRTYTDAVMAKDAQSRAAALLGDLESVPDVSELMALFAPAPAALAA